MGTIDTKIIDNIGIIYFNRPEKLNSFNAQMGRDYNTALHEMTVNDNIAVVIITGRGKAFSVGADLSEGAQSFDKTDNFSSSPVTPAYDIHKPVIAAMQGHALGLGFGIALQCDIRLVGEDAKYGLIQASLGLISDCNSHWLLPKLIGLEQASLFLMQAQKQSGKQIVKLGLASACYANEQVLPEAIKLAKTMAQNAPASLSASKQLLWQQLSQPQNQAQQIESDILLQRLKQQDAKQGAEAFIKKQSPKWLDKPRTFTVDNI